MIKFSYNCHSEDGKLKIGNREEFIRDITALEGLNLKITIEQRGARPSHKQRGYYWSVMLPHVLLGLRDAGWGTDSFKNINDVHAYLKNRFCPSEEIVNKDSGEVITLPPSTEKLNTKQREHYHADIRQWAIEYLDYYIPEPNEKLNDKEYSI